MIAIEDLQKKLEQLAVLYRTRTEGGKRASYISELAAVDPSLFSLSVVTVAGYRASAGDSDVLFSMQSISKVATLAFALERFGADAVFSMVGMEPCAEPFNSIMKLEIASCTPLNPFINSGAITIAAMIAGQMGEDALSCLLEFVSGLAGHQEGCGLAVNERIYASESATADRNRALAYFMHSSGALPYDVEDSLELYFKMCSIEANTADLAAIGAVIANGGVNPVDERRLLSIGTVHILDGLMATCGLYNESGEFAVRVGLPAKSGVCGGILCFAPSQMGISVFSPLLDERGNSVAGVKALAALSQDLGLRGFPC